MQNSDYGSTAFAGWRDAAKSDWEDYVGHAFVQQLGAGTLPRKSFLHYLVQDYPAFCMSFCRVWDAAQSSCMGGGKVKNLKRELCNDYRH